MNPKLLVIAQLMQQGYSQEEAMRLYDNLSPTTQQPTIGAVPKNTGYLFGDNSGGTPVVFGAPTQGGTPRTGTATAGTVLQQPVIGVTPTDKGPMFGENYGGQEVEGLKRNEMWDIKTPDYMSNKQPKQYTIDPNQMTEAQKQEYVRQQQEKGDTQAPPPWYGQRGMPLLFPGGTDISTELFTAGRAIGAKKGTRGRGLAIASGLGAASMDIARNIASGIGYSKANQYVQDWYRQQQFGPDNQRYTAVSQTRNTNTTGGADFLRGGEYNSGSFYEDGGYEGDIPADNGQNEMLAQLEQQILQYLQQGMSPQMILQALVKKGMDEDQAQQLIAQVVQNAQENPQPTEEGSGEEAQASEEGEEQMTMRNGGVFKYNVGDYIKFKHNGQMVEGKIKKIDRKSGKIYL